MPYVLDASSLIAYLRDEEGAEIVEDLLINDSCITHAFNLCELYTKFCQAEGLETAHSAIEDLKNLGLQAFEVMDEQFWKAVSSNKVNVKKILTKKTGNFPWGESFLLTLAQERNGTVVTADRTDFTDVEAAGLCQVKFIR